nr:G protein-coupled receptor [Proales similis]
MAQCRSILRISFVIIYLLCIQLGRGLIIKSEERYFSEDWVLLGKFCFISSESFFRFEVSYPKEYAVPNLLLYYDNQWGNVYPRPERSCRDKVNELFPVQILPLQPFLAPESNQSFVCQESESRFECEESRGFISSRPRWWFIVMSRCQPRTSTQSNQGIKIKYFFNLTNGDYIFRHHFSADEFGILETSIAMTIWYFLMLLFCAVYAKILIKRTLFHITFRLFIASVGFQFLHFLFYMSEYAQFAYSGIFTPGMIVTARLFDAIAQFIFLIMLILLAKGYTVTRSKLRKITAIKLLIFSIIYAVAYIVAFIYSEVLYDPGKVNYYLNSPGGIAIICIKFFLGWPWFCYAIVFTLKNFPEKRKFYVILLIYFTIWFWLNPLLSILSIFVIADHVRQFYAFLIQSLLVVFAHSYFLILTRPTKGNKSFPYHAKTSQIGFLESTGDNGELPHHKEDEGGNTNFSSSLPIDEIFTVKDPAEKYQIGSDVDESQS